MELIQLTPHSEIDPSQPLRAPGDILLHAYLIPSALNPAQLARRIGIPANHIKAFIADTHPITAKIALRLSLTFDTTAFYWLALQARYDLERSRWSALIVLSLTKNKRTTNGIDKRHGARHDEGVPAA